MRCAHGASHRAGSSGARRGGGGGSPPRRGPAPRPRGPPRRIARRVCPHPPLCARLGPGPLRPSLPGPWALGPGSPAPFSPLRPRRCARAPWALGARLPSGSRAGAPAAAGRACPPHGLPVRPGLRCSAGFLAGDRSPLLAAPVPPGLRGGPACSPLRCRGGPWARLGPPPARWCPPSLHRRGARAGCGPRFGARCAPRRGYGFVGPGSFAPAVAGVGGPVPLGGPVRPAPPLRAAILYRKCSVLEHVLSAAGSRREPFPLALGLIPCAYSYATEKATVCHRLGSTTSIPSPGIRRRDIVAPRVLVP